MLKLPDQRSDPTNNFSPRTCELGAWGMERMAQIAEPQTFCRLPYAAPYRNTIALGELRVLSRAARRRLVAARQEPDRAPSNLRL